MANADALEHYTGHARHANYLFGCYRSEGHQVNRQVPPRLYFDFVVPAPNKPPLFDGIDWGRWVYDMGAPSVGSISGATINDDTDDANVQQRYRECLNWFSNNRGWRALKVLGRGGQGLAIRYTYNNPTSPGVPRDLVVKIALREWENKAMRDEIRATRV